MKFVDHIRFRLSQALGPALVLVGLFYFGYHAIEGNHGLLKLRDVNAEIALLEGVAISVSAERRALEIKVGNLRRDNLDLDLLDERVRDVLGFQDPDEFVIFLEKEAE